VWIVVGLLALLVIAGAVAYVMTRGHHVSPSPTPSASPSASPSTSPSASPSTSPSASPSTSPPPSSGCKTGEFGDKCQSNQCNACPMYFTFEGVDDTDLSCTPTLAYKRKCLGTPCESKSGKTVKFPLAEYVNGDPADVATKRKQWAQENLTAWDDTVQPCSGNGTCSADGTCKCSTAYYGNSCADKYCGSQDPKNLSKWDNEAACCTTARPDTVKPTDTVCQFFGDKNSADYGVQRCTVPASKYGLIAAFDKGIGFSYCYSNICPNDIPVNLLRQYHSDKQCCTDDLYDKDGHVPPDGTTVCVNYPGSGADCLRSCTYVAGAPLAPGQSTVCTTQTNNTCIPSKAPATGKSQLLPNMYLNRGQFLESGNGFRFGLSQDGLTAQKFQNDQEVWNTTQPGWGTPGITLTFPAKSITMEQGTWVMKDEENGGGQTLAYAKASSIGNACTANPKCVKETGTDPGYDCCPRRLVMQGDGNLVIYRGPTETQCPNCPTWSTIGNQYGPYAGGGPMALGKIPDPITPGN
jgi:hypothetical protein